MNKLKPFHSAIRFLCLIATLLALSQVANAGNVYFKNSVLQSDWNADQTMTYDSSSGKYIYEFDATYAITQNNGYFMFYDANQSKDYGYENATVSFSNGEYTTSLYATDKALKMSPVQGRHYKVTYTSSSSPTLKVQEYAQYNLCSEGSTVISAFTCDYDTRRYTVTTTLTNGQKFHILMPESYSKGNISNSNWYGPSSNTNVSGSLTGGSTAGNSNYYTWTGATGEVTISFTATGAEPKDVTITGKEKEATDIYLRGGDFGWSTNNYQFTWDSSKSCFTLSNVTLTQAFKFYVKSPDTWYRSSDTSIKSGTEYSLGTYEDETNMTPNGTLSDATIYIYTDTGTEYGTPSKFKIEGKSNIPTSGVNIYSDFSGSGTFDTEGVAMTKENDSDTNQWIYKFTCTADGTYHFYFYDAEGYSVAKGWAYAGSDNLTVSKDTSSSSFSTTSGYKFALAATSGKVYTIKYWNEYGGSHKVEITNVASAENAVTMTVYPKGIYSKTKLATYTEPTYYFCCKVLNNNTITPDYQFQKVDDNTYELEFTLRNTKCVETVSSGTWPTNECLYRVVGYDTPTTAKKTVVDYTAFNPINSSTANKEGRRYKATLNLSGTPSVTFTEIHDAKGKDYMPFISMIGADWKQSTEYTTPAGLSTNKGWQEAWIQYNDKGQVAKDVNGKVMYNTAWPPLNPIMFSTKFTADDDKEYEFTLNSEDLQFTPGETHPGSYWKNSSPFYELGTLDLADNTDYRIYTVSDMWINGEVKLWTGWNGEHANGNGDANWSNHANWGHYGQSKDAVTIDPDTTVPLGTANGNMKFETPTYFKNVYFFYNVSDPQSTGSSKLFTERNYADAQISALSYNEYTQGNFRPVLGNTTGIEDNIQSVRIQSFTTDGEPVATLLNLSNIDWSISDFESNLQTALTGKGYTYLGRSGYYLDPTTYSSGNYEYRLYVTIGYREVEAESNPFTIVNPNVNLELKAYQLVLNLDDSKEINGRTIDYFTYSLDSNNGYAIITTDASHDDVVASGDDTDLGTQYSYTAWDYSSNPVDFQYPDFCRWTDRVLLVGTDLTKQSEVDEVLGYSINDTATDVNGSFSTTFAQGSKNRFMEVVKNGYHRYSDNGNGTNTTEVDDTTTEHTYNLQARYNAITTDDEGNEIITTRVSDLASVDFTPVIPEPSVDYAYVYGYNNDDDVEFINIDGETTLEAAYNQLKYKADLIEPKMSQSMKDKFNYYNTITLDGVAITLDDSGSYYSSAKAPSYLESNSCDITLTTAKDFENETWSCWEDWTIDNVSLALDNSPQMIISDASKTYRYDDSTGKYTEVLYFKLQLDANGNNINWFNDVLDENYNSFTLHNSTENDWLKIELINDKDEVYKTYYKNAADLLTEKGVEIKEEAEPVTWFAEMGATWTLPEKCRYVKAQFIYPFLLEINSSGAPAKAAAQKLFPVEYSEASKTEVKEVATDVETVQLPQTSVKAGIGYIDIEGDNAEIYSVDGIRVAGGEGHHELSQGVYLVVMGNKTQKVIVR